MQHARWLAELTAALDRACTLTLTLPDYCNDGCEASVLRAQIRALGAEVDSIQRP